MITIPLFYLALVQERKINHYAYYDALTGLPNRYLLKDRFAVALAQVLRQKKLLAILFLDLDQFKSVNDTWGHAQGDVLLQNVAELLKMCVRPGDTISRLGGDEFVIMLQVTRCAEVTEVTQRILNNFSSPFVLDCGKISVTPTIGISVYPNDGDDLERLVKKADMAMYQAKEQGKNRFQFYSFDLSGKNKSTSHEIAHSRTV
ncbi:diguanylate cyclase domain-containing protein [Effusibacillus consociatus]|uniref:Diguanylate cyclase domain-containing protein n=1 Tax=Effusibacillus consociatus TaxID=1117041 RepID=A0ABV9PXI3_9BACL